MAYELSNITSVKPIDPVTMLRLKDVTMYTKINQFAKSKNAIVLDNVVEFNAKIPNQDKILKYYAGIDPDGGIYYTSSDICGGDMKGVLESLAEIDKTLIAIVSFREIESNKPNNNPTLKCVIEGTAKSMDEAKEMAAKIAVPDEWEYID